MTPVHMPPPDALHGTVDKIIRRQQGRLFSQFREKRLLNSEIERLVCWSFTYTGRDIHMAIDGESWEAPNETTRN